MKAIIPGHRYELANFEAKDQPGQQIVFIRKVPPGEPNGFDGTTNEEVLKMLIDRFSFIHGKTPSEETRLTIDHLRQALYCQHSRTYERIQAAQKPAPPSQIVSPSPSSSMPVQQPQPPSAPVVQSQPVEP